MHRSWTNVARAATAGLGLFACLATSPPPSTAPDGGPKDITARAFLYSELDRPIQLTVDQFGPRDPHACLEDLDQAVARARPYPWRTNRIELIPGEAEALWGGDSSQGCHVVRVQGDSVPTTWFVWTTEDIPVRQLARFPRTRPSESGRVSVRPHARGELRFDAKGVRGWTQPHPVRQIAR